MGYPIPYCSISAGQCEHLLLLHSQKLGGGDPHVRVKSEVYFWLHLCKALTSSNQTLGSRTVTLHT